MTDVERQLGTVWEDMDSASESSKPAESYEVKDPIMTKKAWNYYNNPSTLQGVRPRQVLLLECLQWLRDELGRPIEQEEIRRMVHLDRGADGKVLRSVCAETRKSFAQFRFTNITKRLLVYARKNKKIDEKAPFDWLGCVDEYGKAYSGPLFTFTHVKDKPDRYFIADSPLGKAYRRFQQKSSG